MAIRINNFGLSALFAAWLLRAQSLRNPYFYCSRNGIFSYQRGHQEDYNSWAKAGCQGWSWNEVEPVFKRTRYDPIHNPTGEVAVNPPRVSWQILDTFGDAAAQAGIPLAEDFTNSDKEGYGYFQVTQKQGVRQSAYRAFLHPIMSRPNLTVITKAHCKKIVIGKTGRAVAIDFWTRGTDGLRRVEIQKEAILSAGAIGSPHLLQVSGVGNPEDLLPHGVPVRNKLEGVGSNLHDHLQIRSTFRLKDGTDTLNTRLVWSLKLNPCPFPNTHIYT